MKQTPFQLYLRSMIVGASRSGHLEKHEAYERLKKLTGEDFGFDIEGWREWGKSHPETSGICSLDAEVGDTAKRDL